MYFQGPQRPESCRREKTRSEHSRPEGCGIQKKTFSHEPVDSDVTLALQRQLGITVRTVNLDPKYI